MGRRNRERRAAKARKRRSAPAKAARETGAARGASSAKSGGASAEAGGASAGADNASSDPHATSAGPQDAWADAERGADLVEAALRAASDVVARGEVAAGDECAQSLLHSRSTVPAALVVRGTETELHRHVRRAWSQGWQPVDLVQMARRRQPDVHVALLVDALASDAVSYAPATVDPRWWEQLRELGADPNMERHRRGQSGTWLTAADRQLGEAVAMTVHLLAFVSRLPRLVQLLPLPGQAPVSGVSGARAGQQEEVDQRQLSRIRALLAKAESTDFPDEAEALSAKAQQLMARHAIERILVDAVSPDGARPAATARRLWLDSPYSGAKALLVHAVAAANGCQAVWAENLGFTTVVGDESDLAGVELLCTSLLVQANRAMLAHGDVRDVRGTSRTRSFRQSFLVAYANRIGERLREASAGGLQDVAAEHGGVETAALLPVLAQRAERVEETRRELFPQTVSRPMSASNPHGWAAGHAAADLAALDVARQVRGAERPAS